MCNTNNKKQAVNTPYDNAYRTLLDGCPRFIIPLINEIFGENYTGNERIEQSPNEFFIISEDDKKIVTDSVFTIYGETIAHYHIECQSSPDGTILIRMFRYDSQIAVRYYSLDDNVLTVSFPHSAILYLRSTANTPDTSTIRIETPNGSIEYEVKSLKVKEYSIEEIFEKDLLMLIPFHIFSFESRLAEIEDNDEALEQLMSHYSDIKMELDLLEEAGRITAFDRQMIIDMSNNVIESLALKYERVRKGVGEVMGGVILDTEAKRIFREGVAEGINEGIAEGIAKGITEGIAKGITEGIDIGENRYAELTTYLLEQNRYADLDRAAKDKQYRMEIFAEMDNMTPAHADK